MRAQLSRADAVFVDAVAVFIAEAWTDRMSTQRPAEPAAAAVAHWYAALAERGWAVPHWPVAWGGAGWSPRQLYLWRAALAQAGAPLPAPAAIDWAGPALWRWGDAAQQARWLPGIRALRDRWCLGLAEPGAQWQLQHIDTVARARRGADGAYRVDGVKAWVADADSARWLLLLARTGPPGDSERALSLFVLDLQASGLTLTPMTLLDGRARIFQVALAGVRVPAAHRLGAEGAGLAAVRVLAGAAERQIEPAVGLARLLTELAAVARELPGDGGERLADEAGFAGRLAALGVELAGLEAMEWRWLAECDASVRAGAGDSGMASDRRLALGPAVMGLRRTAIAERIGALCSAAFGYYALPSPDPVTIHNEGPIGHHYALAALRGMLATRLSPIDGSSSEAYRDRIANQLSGL
jgi:alkylation response protein AidB-like acyl-CoA dehydrogenase